MAGRTIAVLGTGIMGAPIARNLARSGHDVRAWNRSRARAEALAGDGVSVAATAGEAVTGADTLVTMLSDGDAVEAVVSEAAPAAAGGTLWLQMSTVGEEAADRLAGLAARHGLVYVDAPVLGTRQPAEQGALLILASGPKDSAAAAAEVFDVVGTRTLWLGPAGRGSRLKLVVNNWLLGLVGALAETLALAQALDVDPGRFLEAIRDGPVGAPYAQSKGAAMLAGEFDPAFPLRLALKDARLVLDAAVERGLGLTLTDAVAARFAAAVDAGHGDEDMSAVFTVIR